MTKYRYRWGNGLDCGDSDDKDEKLLEDMASQGYAFDKITAWGFYKFRAAQAEECNYAIDFSSVREADEEFAEYLEIFSAGGWEYVTSLDNIHYFKAPKGTKPIYTDGNSMAEMYVKKQKTALRSVITSAIFAVACFALYIATSSFYIHILAFIGIGTCVSMFYTMQQNKKWAARLQEGEIVTVDCEEIDSAKIYEERCKLHGRSLLWSIISVAVTITVAIVVFGMEFFGIIPSLDDNLGAIITTILGVTCGASIVTAISSAIGFFKNKRKAAERREGKC